MIVYFRIPINVAGAYTLDLNLYSPKINHFKVSKPSIYTHLSVWGFFCFFFPLFFFFFFFFFLGGGGAGGGGSPSLNNMYDVGTQLAWL